MIDLLRRPLVRNGVVAIVLAAVIAVSTAPATQATAVPGSSGTDISLPATASQVTVSGRGAFANLKFTVNQTKNLVNQAVSIKWSGGQPTVASPQLYSGNLVQIMQCWGDDDGSTPENPGPPPEQCQWGGIASQYSNPSLGFLYPFGYMLTRVESVVGWPNASTSTGFIEPSTKYIWRPFRAVDGTVVNSHYDPNFNPDIVGGNYWLNPYFNSYTTNEVANGKIGADGTGQTLFEVQTGLEAPGLGCAQRLVMEGTTKTPKCWIVIVPRSTPSVENLGTPFASTADQVGSVTSPLAASQWRHRIAIPLEFNSLDTACDINDADRRIVGSELSLTAVASWQSALCLDSSLPPFTYGVVPDAAGRKQIVSPTTGAAGMAVTSSPITAADADPASPVVYAPVSASGVVIGFNIERTSRLNASDAQKALDTTPVASLNLTPRHVAKLLTQSYRFQVQSFATVDYPWLATNPTDLSQDPDFQQFNPEFSALRSQYSKNLGGLVLPSRNADASRVVWQWILADPEAKAWLDGAPDPWGMKVNPVWSTAAATNPSGIPFAADGPPDSYPKNEPYCFQAPTLPGTPPVVPPPLCGTDLLPYSQGYGESARAVRIADDSARTLPNDFAASPDQFWKRSGPQVAGTRAILGLTDSPSATRFGVQMARLSRAGDNSASRRFIAADTAGLSAGIVAMTPKTERAVRELDPLAAAPDAYPLTVLTYAALRPLSLDATARAEYASFLDYVGGVGQTPGLEPGRLPQGYAPLPEALRNQTIEAARTVRDLQPATAPPVEVNSFSTFSTPSFTTATTVPSAADPVPVVTATVTDDVPLALTPVVALARNRFVVPALAGLALFAALTALEITRRPRRVAKPSGTGS